MVLNTLEATLPGRVPSPSRGRISPPPGTSFHARSTPIRCRIPAPAPTHFGTAYPIRARAISPKGRACTILRYAYVEPLRSRNPPRRCLLSSQPQTTVQLAAALRSRAAGAFSLPFATGPPSMGACALLVPSYSPSHSHPGTISQFKAPPLRNRAWAGRLQSQHGVIRRFISPHPLAAVCTGVFLLPSGSPLQGLSSPALASLRALRSETTRRCKSIDSPQTEPSRESHSRSRATSHLNAFAPGRAPSRRWFASLSGTIGHFKSSYSRIGSYPTRFQSHSGTIGHFKPRRGGAPGLARRVSIPLWDDWALQGGPDIPGGCPERFQSHSGTIGHFNHVGRRYLQGTVKVSIPLWDDWALQRLGRRVARPAGGVSIPLWDDWALQKG